MESNEGDFEYILNLQKIETDSDDHIIVAGVATTEKRDHDNEIVDLESVRGVWKDYMANPVVRYFHGKDKRNPDAVGKVIPEYTDSTGKTYKTEMTEKGPFIVAKLSNAPDTASIRQKVSEGILKGFSIGGRAQRVKEFSHELGKDINRVFTKRISEISIVDLPANPDSFFTVLKGCVGGQCNLDIKNETPELVTMCAPDTYEADRLKSVEEEIAKIEADNEDLRKEIETFQSHTNSTEVVMKNKKIDNTIGGIIMEQEDNVVRFEPTELKDFIKSTMDEYATETEIVEKADDYDRLLAETKELRKKIEGLEAAAQAAAKKLAGQAQTTMKSETETETDEVEKSETEEVEVEKSEEVTLESRLEKLEESPMYKAVQTDDLTKADETKVVKGHLANIVAEAFGTGGK